MQTVNEWVLLSLEYRTPGKVSQPVRFKDQKEHLYVCVYYSTIYISQKGNTDVEQHQGEYINTDFSILCELSYRENSYRKFI